ncbi:MAG: glycosyltransferase family 39 protein, partial [Elusimicrobia bacterium]|nr:glycosyltransferase family 39 protein [Elusimicrobiota bacterium]
MSRRAWTLLALALAARLAFAAAMPAGGRGAPMPDNDGYVGLARSFAATGSLLAPDGTPSALREPVFPLVLGCLFKAFGAGYGVVLLLNTALGLAMLWLLMRLGDELLGPPVGEAALALGALYPAFLYHNAQPMRETALTLASVAVVAAVLRARRAGSARAWAAAAVVTALASLTNTTFLPFALILVPAGLLWEGRAAAGPSLRRAAAYLAVFCVLYAPWPARNYARFGRVILGSTAGAGSTFYTYLVVPQEIGGLPAQTRLTDADPVFKGALGLAPAASEAYFWRQGLARVRRHPLAYARLVAWRFFVDIWRVVPRPRPGEGSRRLLVWASVLSDGWVLPAALAGAVLAGTSAPGLFWAYALVASVNGVYALVLTSIRYRISAMPWALLLAAYALVRHKPFPG